MTNIIPFPNKPTPSIITDGVYIDSQTGRVHGTPAMIPEGAPHDGQGYMRTTGRWRSSDNGSLVEVYCLKSRKSAYVHHTKLSGPNGIRLFDDLT